MRYKKYIGLLGIKYKFKFKKKNDPHKKTKK